ncbi:hypothetical protein M1349_02850 [Patescibacteria group bacterium]|nr:hypothetical protein [Patescibacteria group bacterium]
MSEKELKNNFQDKKNRLSRVGWVEMLDGREDGRFVISGEFNIRYSSFLFEGVIADMDQYGHFLVWNSEKYLSETKIDQPEIISKRAIELRKEGWEVRNGIVNQDGEEVHSLVAIKKKIRQSRRIYPPTHAWVKGVYKTIESY